MPFASDIVGHETQIAALRQALEQDRLHHAYVFLGPEGVGKRTVALALAKAVHCAAASGDFCGRCENCLKIDNQNHPDVRRVQPLAGKRDISIEQVRTLERELGYRSFSGGKKIVVIDPASLMNVPAQNALLKTLEEPPAGSVLILISTSAGGLLATLLSRCLRLAFAPLPARVIAAHLAAGRNLSRERAALMAAVSFGSLGRALDPDLEELARKRADWVEGLDAVARRDGGAWSAMAEGLAKDREETLDFLDWLAAWYRDILILRAAENGDEVSNLDLLDKLRAQAERLSLEEAMALRSRALDAAARVRRNINRRMALENLFVHIAGRPG
jgi:DNA polymerase-3 subunit delta'